jgi:hypothetical protein
MNQDIDPKELGIKPAEMLTDEQRERMRLDAERDLSELGIESRPEHVEAIREMTMTSNFPEGYDDIVQNLHDPEKLKAAMEVRGIKSIIHAEGATVWDHVKGVIRQIDSLNLPDEIKRDLRLTMLYHDVGKAEVAGNAENTARTKKHLDKGELHASMVGHAEARADQMRAGLAAAGIEGKRLEQLMTAIKYHMNTSIPEQDPKKTVKLVQSFGETEEERREVVDLLAASLYVDGNGTHHAELQDGELKITRNEKKLTLSGDVIWQKYQEGLRMIQAEAEAAQKKKEQEDFIISVLGSKPSEYLQAKGVRPGPEMGKQVKQLQQIILGTEKKLWRISELCWLVIIYDF